MSYAEDKIELQLAEKDKHHVEKFKEFLGIPNQVRYKESTKSYRVSFRSQNCKADLIRLGCTPRKSLTLRFPTEEQVPRHLIRHFIRGYFDGDGWFTNTDSCLQVGFISTEEFIKSVLEILNGMINTHCTIQDVHRSDGAKRYMFGAKQDVYNFLSYIYKDATVYLDRKYEKYLDYIQQFSN